VDDFELEIKTEFLNEALMNLEEVESSFMELESASDTKPLLDKIFRLAHNLKGGSRAVGFGEVAEFTHQLESLVLKLQRNEIPLSSEMITTLLHSNDRLVEMLSALKGNFTATFDNTDILAELSDWLTGKRTATVSAEVAAPAAEAIVIPDAGFEITALTDPPLAEAIPEEGPPAVPDSNAFFAGTEIAIAPVAEIKAENKNPPEQESVAIAPVPAMSQSKVEAPAKQETPKQQGKEDEIIRVSLSRIDFLNDYVGELIVLQSVIQQQSLLGNSVKLQASIRQMTKISKDIQNLSMSLRMLPVKPLIQKLQRVVRDTAKALEKEVDLVLIGEQMDIDKSVMDRLADPLIHILRNAVDHGLESPADRIAAGKAPEGKVFLSLSNEGNHLVVEVRDDGKGINSEVLLRKAVEKGLVSEGQQLTEKQIINLIFHPGFSTKAVTSEISGRGVGMDVVKTNVEKIGGIIDISTTVGVGSIFKLQIPLSLAVVEGLVVTSASHRYVVPLSQVQETINLKSQKVFGDKLGIGACFELRGEVVQLIDLDEALGNKSAKLKLDGTALIINCEDRHVALLVHDVVRAQQIVIKPFGNGIHAQRGWIGSCVLGDGLPTLIVSPVDLLVGRVAQSMGEEMRGAA
jgi:two-component system chemotaxis sensor kinase CheA